MEIVKLLERKAVIRFFGIALLLSPFFNTFLTILTFPPNQARWTWKVFWYVTSHRSAVDQLLYISTFIIGILMLRGAPWAWKCLLVLLGAYITNQTFHFGANFRANKMSAFFFLMNVGVFLFIADQLAWKLKKGLASQPKTTEKISAPAKDFATELKSSKKVLIHFFNVGPWAELVEISKDGLWVQKISDPPSNIESKEIEILLDSSSPISIVFVEKKDSLFFFKFKNLTPQSILALNLWLQRQAA